MPERVGVFVCHCGQNVAGVLDVEKLRDEISKHPKVVHAEDYVFMCSDPGQERIKRAIEEKELDGVVVAACSPTLHEDTFRRAASSAGLNPYLVEVANIREWVSWPHREEGEAANTKVIRVVRSSIAKLLGNKALESIRVPVTRSVLVIGGGIAGIQAALDIADAGLKVYLVERDPSVGGRMAQLSETFPTLDCPQCILTPKMTNVGHHPNVQLLAYCEVDEISGHAGNFRVGVRRKPTYVDWEKCIGCAACMEVCPVDVPSEYEAGMATRKAIYIPFPQAVPNRAVIDSKNCLRLIHGKGCGLCAKVCPTEAVTFQHDEGNQELEIGAIVVATGLSVMETEEFSEYGYGKLKDVINALQFERILAPSGPTNGEVVRPSDGKVPKEVVFIQCVGSRDPENWKPYCSKICCMYTAKQAMLYRHAVPDGQAYVFYIDIRSDGKGYEEFIHRTMEEERVLYIRGKVGKVYQEGDKLRVIGADTLSGKKVEIDADLVVLATAAIPSLGIEDLANRLRIQLTENGWVKEAHLKLRPLETLTSGIFTAGAAQFPKDITYVVAQASGAAAKALDLLARDEIEREPTIAQVNGDICTACGNCVEVCPYDAVELSEEKVAKVNEVTCQGCGVCVAACPSGAISLLNYDSKQILDMISSLVEGG